MTRARFRSLPVLLSVGACVFTLSGCYEHVVSRRGGFTSSATPPIHEPAEENLLIFSDLEDLTETQDAFRRQTRQMQRDFDRTTR